LPERGPGAGLSSDVFFFLIAEDGSVVNNARNVDADSFPLAELTKQAEGGPAWSSPDVGGTHYRVLALPAQSESNQQFTLVVGRSLESRDYQLRTLAIVLGAGGVAGLVLAAGAGFLLAGRTLVPIRRSLETQRRFVSDASHELRTPLAVMKANAEILLRHPDQTVEANVDQVAAINEEADHLTRLVGDLLTLARADEHRLEVAKERLRPDQMIEGLVRDMGAVAAAKGVELRAQLGPAEVEGDPQRLRQLAAILLDNALKYTPQGGHIELVARPQGSRWVLTVSDTGPGIPAQAQARIFDRFYRADDARGPQGGTGLGLAIARWIAEAHQGRISVSSQPGRGSTFTVTLPLVRG
jgi:two-component system, OmpR family, sensor histidine kinase CiaH